jgi:hypothetical protein
LHTDGVAVGLELEAVGVVAVGAAHALPVHPALQHGAVDIDLVELLAVGVVEPGAQELGAEVVEEGGAGLVAVGEALAAGMAGAALVHLEARVAARKSTTRP